MTRPFRSIAFTTVLALAASRASVAQVAAPAMVGRWVGEAKITVSWTRQRVLPIDITICLGDTVRGTVGDALLAAGRLETGEVAAGRAAWWVTDYVISGNLDGAIIRAENIRRPSVRLAFNLRDTILEGVLTTPGWRLLNTEVKTIAATFVLHRAPAGVLSVRGLRLNDAQLATQRPALASAPVVWIGRL